MFKKKYIFLIVIIIFIVTIFDLNYKNNIFRLHVVGNSNSIEDKIIKLKISGKINDYISSIIETNITKDELYELLKEKNNEILNICNSEIKNNNKNYEAKINIGKIYYDKKDNIYSSMDKGIYNSIKIILGEGKGENFFDILLPNKENIKKLKNLETIIPGIANVYDDTNISYEFKFDCLEKLRKKIKIL